MNDRHFSVFDAFAYEYGNSVCHCLAGKEGDMSIKFSARERRVIDSLNLSTVQRSEVFALWKEENSYDSFGDDVLTKERSWLFCVMFITLFEIMALLEVGGSFTKNVAMAEAILFLLFVAADVMELYAFVSRIRESFESDFPSQLKVVFERESFMYSFYVPAVFWCIDVLFYGLFLTFLLLLKQDFLVILFTVLLVAHVYVRLCLWTLVQEVLRQIENIHGTHWR